MHFSTLKRTILEWTRYIYFVLFVISTLSRLINIWHFDDDDAGDPIMSPSCNSLGSVHQTPNNECVEGGGSSEIQIYLGRVPFRQLQNKIRQ